MSPASVTLKKMRGLELAISSGPAGLVNGFANTNEPDKYLLNVVLAPRPADAPLAGPISVCGYLFQALPMS